MSGLMQDKPLLISDLIEFAAQYHGGTEVISRRVEGDIHRSTWAQVAARARQVAHALDGWRIGQGSRVATLAWNGYRHLELYFGVSGSGRVLHTINPRLHPEQIAWIMNHAEDEVLCFEASFLPLVQAVWQKCPTVKRWVLLCEADKLPADTGIPGLVSYEAWIAGQATTYAWPKLDENAASSMCYTSGTTGNPKAALYSHRSTVLHTYASVMPDGLNLSSRDAVLPVVPMFHVNAWGIPYSTAMVGAKLVLPGPALDGESVFNLIEAEGVSIALGVPTVWQMLLGHVAKHKQRFSTLKLTVIGGAAAPAAMIQTFEKDYGVEVRHAWGMTEMSPLGTAASLGRRQAALSDAEQLAIKTTQGRAIFGVEMRIVGDGGKALPWDGKAFGDLHVRGPWIIREYYKAGESALVDDGWFPTGDVATIDAEGYMHITDRSKDVVKSGGEWLSTIDIENIAMGHPAVAMAAAIGVKHPKWDERPIVVVVKKPDAQVSREELLAFYEGKLAKWQCPDDVVFVDAIPLGATGKMLKTELRKQLAGYKLPELA
ncbi:long-chain fatty acid--CoA ligase [Comamonas serinivorans]|uniref:Long-chain fatty acid--CoA ligase n=1 Tax=Comamonas serinivorans TaxID=1082851 RepID=A0A1Y0EST5_9BURK|nr:3-(methylthio)propionyl-CoA ligase [Comamonas serinivorans]ARU06673.1 long-chain fatty acid--CoA ligase [Comamonas serinivorans]